MTKNDLVENISKELGFSKITTRDWVNTILQNIMQGIKKKGEVTIQGFGTFKKSKRKAKPAVDFTNPSKRTTIPAMNVVTFKPGSEFKGLIK